MSQADRLVWLDQADAQNPALVGAKAARLAQARSCGLPVLDGFVVPVHACGAAISQGEKKLRTPRHSGAARSAVFNHRPFPLMAALSKAAATLGETVVVRSSSRVEAEGMWAGAFASYLELRPKEVATGVIGCWASVFNPDALRRANAQGISPADIGMAVLVQPQLQVEWGGVATLTGRGEIVIVGMEGHHAPLVAGWESGHVTVVTSDGTVQAPDGSPLSTELVREVAHLTRRSREEVGYPHVEWAMGEDREIYLLQAQPSADRRPIHLRPKAPRVTGKADRGLGNMVRTMLRYPGPLGERLVWPWAIGLDDLPAVRSAPSSRRPEIIVPEIREIAALLTSQRWQEAEVPQAPSRAWAKLLGGDTSTGREWLSRPSTVDLGLARTHLESLGELASALEQAGEIPHPGWMWYLDPDTLDMLRVRRESFSRRVGTGRWEHLIYGVVVSLGDTHSGHPAAAGWGVGRLRYIGTAEQAASFAPREVIVADQPLGNLAPLLWDAAGIVTAGGSPGAHLFEVAKSLGVPAVCGVDVRPWIDGDRKHPEKGESLGVAVDGDRGRIALLPSNKTLPPSGNE